MTLVHGTIQAFVAVAAGAFGAHGLKGSLDEYSMGIWQLAMTYQMWHALGLLALGLFEQRGGKVKGAHLSFGIGIFLFSGSLYAIALSGLRPLGLITPLGGISLLVGWALFARAAYKARTAA